MGKKVRTECREYFGRKAALGEGFRAMVAVIVEASAGAVVGGANRQSGKKKLMVNRHGTLPIGRQGLG